MPQIFDNIDNHLITDLRSNFDGNHRADFCVGYFNLRGWGLLADKIDLLTGGEEANCRLLIGMVGNVDVELRRRFRVTEDRPPTQGEIRQRQTQMLKPIIG